MDFAHISIGPITLHFYGLMYALAALSGVFFTYWIAKKKNVDITRTDLGDIIFWVMIGGVLGGRLGYIFIYDFSYFLQNPSQMLAVWNGGMSIHGGLLGGGIALVSILKIKKLPFAQTVDIMMPALALGLAFGRLGNFVNGELPGRITDSPWGMDFGDGENRHVSSLYSVAKDVLICGILLFISLLIRPKVGVVTGLFFILYGIFRFIVEFFRQPDAQVGFLVVGLSMGQILSIFVFLFGVGYLFWVRKR